MTKTCLSDPSWVVQTFSDIFTSLPFKVSSTYINLNDGKEKREAGEGLDIREQKSNQMSLGGWEGMHITDGLSLPSELGCLDLRIESLSTYVQD
jgi:hypothetical protein